MKLKSLLEKLNDAVDANTAILDYDVILHVNDSAADACDFVQIGLGDMGSPGFMVPHGHEMESWLEEMCYESIEDALDDGNMLMVMLS